MNSTSFDAEVIDFQALAAPISGLIPEEGNQAFLPDWALLSMAALMKALNSG
jgi:hypothetical protein